MQEPSQVARYIEEHPRLPPGASERVAGYGVMGLPFRSGHVLGLRRWAASSVGPGFTSVWHRDPKGSWTFYESVDPAVACTRFFGAGVEHVRVGPIALEWEGQRRLQVRTRDNLGVDWTLQLGSTVVTRAMSVLGSAIPTAVWRWRPMLSVMGRLAGPALGAGEVRLTGMTSNGQLFDANPLQIWYVTDSRAVVDGEELGPIGPLPDQAHLADFYFPQRGIFAVGRMYVTPLTKAS
jgi:hypothetical protein